ncbi:hypothetical protein U1Q18_007190 [Sarracenia purpurea var. burkii]
MDTSKEVNFKIAAIELVVPPEASPTEPDATALPLRRRAPTAIRWWSGHKWHRQLPDAVGYFAAATGGNRAMADLIPSFSSSTSSCFPMKGGTGFLYICHFRRIKNPRWKESREIEAALI